MSNLTLLRTSSNTDSTLGELFWSDPGVDQWMAYTLEDEHRDVKVMHETRIPDGRYPLALRKEGGMYNRRPDLYPHGMIWIKDVPDFEWIYIHPGTDDDHTSGCILVGDGVTQNVTRAGRLLNSVLCFSRIYPRIVAGITNGSLTHITVATYA